MSKEVPGGSKPLRSWERWYWGVAVVGISIVLYSRLKPSGKTPEQLEEERQRAAALEEQRKERMRSILMGRHFIEGKEDPFEGMSPKQIQDFVNKSGINVDDPLEGLSPEEIDAYMQQQGIASS
eukprot:jgi/Chrzof1/11854/Cz06g12140.t1